MSATEPTTAPVVHLVPIKDIKVAPWNPKGPTRTDAEIPSVDGRILVAAGWDHTKQHANEFIQGLLRERSPRREGRGI